MRSSELARQQISGTSLRIPYALPILAGIFSLCLVMLGTAGLASARFARPFSDFTRDPAAVLEESAGCGSGGCMVVGFISSVGGLVWAAAAALCLFTALVLRLVAGRRVLSSPYLYFGLLSLALTLDETFLIHELTAPLIAPGQSEAAFYAVYAVWAVALVIVFRDFLARTSFGILGVAMALFAAAVSLDVAVPDGSGFEDSVKFLGIAAWATFLAGTSAIELVRTGVRAPAHTASR